MHLEIDKGEKTLHFKGTIERARWLLQQQYIPNYHDWKTLLRKRIDRLDHTYDLTHLNNVVESPTVIEKSKVPASATKLHCVRNTSTSKAYQIELTVQNEVHIRTNSLQVV